MPAKTRSARAVENLASSLIECLNASVDEGARAAASEVERRMNERFSHMEQRLDRQDATVREMREHMEQRLDRQDATVREMREHMDTRLDGQDETLRMVWRQVKGNGKLPIDE